jgi:NADH:ubiquinone oxidoreductase subunit K
MKSKIGDIILILASLLFVFGAIGVLTNSLSQSTLQVIGALALIFVGVGLSLKKRVKK